MSYFGGENIILHVPVILWIGIIIFLSSGKNSVSNTLPFFVRVVEPMLSGAGLAKLSKYFVVFRKTLHFAGYAILALLASVAFSNSSIVFVTDYWHVLSFLVTLIVATADETRQYFDPDRVGSVSDVALDCLGGVTAILIFWLCLSE